MKNRRKFGMLVVSLSLLSAYGAAPTASVVPSWWGAVNNSFFMRYSGDNKVTEYFEVQVKYAGDADFSALGSVPLTVAGTAGQISSVPFDGTKLATFRVRRVNDDGAGDWWTSTQTVAPSLSGTVISSPAESGDAHAPSNVLDGDYSTNYDSAPSSGEQLWIGFDFGELKTVSGVRYFGRYGVSSDNKLARLTGAVVEVARQADFSDAVVGFTIPTPGVQVHSPTFAAPLVGRYARIRNLPSDKVLSVAELGFVGERYVPSEPGVPNVSVSCAFNRCANFQITKDANTLDCRIQRKSAAAGDSAWTNWRVVSGFKSGVATVVGAADLYEDTDFRFRGESGELVSDWSDPVRIKAPCALVGTKIGSPGSYDNNGNVAAKANDGSVFTWFDAPGTPVPAYVGLDLGRPKRITGIRYMPRSDRLTRVVGMKVQVADNPDFANATDVLTIAETPTVAYAPCEATFASPVFARYVRLADDSPTSRYGNVAEVEFLTDVFDLTVTGIFAASAERLTGGFPTVTWADASSGLLRMAVYRATAAGGPWTEMERLPVGTTSWQDTTAAMGVRHYYNVAYLRSSDGHDVAGALSENAAAYRRIHRLERTAEDNTKVKSGVRIVLSNTGNEGNAQWKSANAFDGDVNTSMSCPVEDTRVAVVFDTGNVGVEHVRAHYCKDRSGRLQRACVYATNGNYLDDNPQCSVGCMPYRAGWSSVECDDPGTYRVYYLMRPDHRNFYCCMSELELYGWDASEEADVLIAPTRLRWRVTDAGVTLEWDKCNRAASYRVEKKVGGEWTTAATVSSMTYTDASAEMNVEVAYRIVSLPTQGSELAVSRTFAFVPYRPASGTGLTGVYGSPYLHNSWSATEERAVVTNSAEAVNFDWERDPLCPAWSDVYNARARWYGKLVVPVSGTYVFGADTCVGCSLGVAVDGAWALNADNVQSTSVAGDGVELSSGEHDIYVEFLREQTDAKLMLRWQGPIAEEVVPVTQLIPTPPHDFGDWTLERTFNTLGGRLPNLAKAFPLEDGILFNRGRKVFDGTTQRYHALERSVRGNFILSFHLKAVSPSGPIGQRFGIMVSRDADPTSPMVFAHIGWSANGSQGAVCTAERRTSAANDTVYSSWKLVGTGFIGTSGEGDVRISRENGSVRASYFDTQKNAWVEFMRYDGTDAYLGRNVQLSLACACGVSSPEADIMWKLSNMKFEKVPSGLAIIVK